MPFTLYFHPLSSFCQKALVGLYELEVAFIPRIVDLSKDDERAMLTALWPMVRFPVLHDQARGLTLPESSILLEHVDRVSTTPGRLVPSDPDRARQCRLRDRIFDFDVELPMQKIVGDALRPKEKRDPHGVEQARAQLAKAYALIDEWLREGPWALGEAFTMVDCGAAPALFYANKVAPFGETQRHLRAYYARLERRASFARVLEEAKPYLALFPG